MSAPAGQNVRGFGRRSISQTRRVMNTECLFSMFDTSIGPCGIVWTKHGVAGLNLPEADEDRTRARILRRFPGATAASPSPEIQRAIDGIAALLRGEASDLGRIVLDMRRLPAFDRRVYQAARGIAPGMTLTYGELAGQLGDSGLARAVGQALARNPMAIIVPCHRVLAAGGKYGGFSANGGVTTKLKLLAIEGARRSGAPDLFSVRT